MTDLMRPHCRTALRRTDPQQAIDDRHPSRDIFATADTVHLARDVGSIPSPT